MRAKFLWKVADDLKVTFTGDWTHDDTSAAANDVVGLYGGGGTFYDIYNACIAGAPLGFLCQRSNEGGPIQTMAPGTGRVPYSSALVQTGNIDTTYANGDNFSKMDSFGGSVTADWTLSDSFALKSISGYRRINWKVGLDQDGSTLQIQEPSFTEGQHQFSEELQGIGKALGGDLNYVAGLYYFNEGGFIHDYVTFPLGLLQIDGLTCSIRHPMPGISIRTTSQRPDRDYGRRPVLVRAQGIRRRPDRLEWLLVSRDGCEPPSGPATALGASGNHLPASAGLRDPRPAVSLLPGR